MKKVAIGAIEGFPCRCQKVTGFHQGDFSFGDVLPFFYSWYLLRIK